MYANTVNLSTGVVTTLTLPADVGSVLIDSPDNPAALTYNIHAGQLAVESTRRAAAEKLRSVLPENPA